MKLKNDNPIWEREHFANQTYAFEVVNEDKYGRDIVKRIGWEGEGTVVAETNDVIVIAWPGVTMNPGSRYSGLLQYYPAKTETYLYVGKDQFDRKRYVSLIEWETRPKKKSS